MLSLSNSQQIMEELTQDFELEQFVLLTCDAHSLTSVLGLVGDLNTAQFEGVSAVQFPDVAVGVEERHVVAIPDYRRRWNSSRRTRQVNCVVLDDLDVIHSTCTFDTRRRCDHTHDVTKC